MQQEPDTIEALIQRLIHKETFKKTPLKMPKTPLVEAELNR
jgi:hypothetical protein